MSKSHSKIIIVAAIVVVAVAVFLARREANHSSTRTEAAKLFESLNIDNIERITLSKDGKEVALKKQAEAGWGVEAHDGFPVDGQKLRRLMLSVAEMKASEKLTDNPEKYERLGLGEKPEKGIVKFFDASGNATVELFLGKNRESKNPPPGQFAPPARGQFIRIGGDPNVYLTADATTIEAEPKQWLDKELLKVKPEELVKIQIEHADKAEGFSISRQIESASFGLDDKRPLPHGKKLKSGELGAISRALQNLNLSDVVKFEDGENQPKLSSTFKATAKDGMVYEVKLGQKDNKYFARIAASYEPPEKTIATEKEGDEEASEKDVEEAGESVYDSSLEEKAKKISARNEKWLFEISKYAFDGLTKKFNDLLEEEKKAEK